MPRAAVWVRGLLFSWFTATVLAYALGSCCPLLFGGFFLHGHALEMVLVFSAMLATSAALASQLPVQNVLLAAVLIFISVLGVLLLNEATGMPFGRWASAAVSQEQLLWVLPALCVILLLNCRGVASLLLNHRRFDGNYGFKVLGLTTLLCFLFVASLEPFAATVNHYWSWRATGIRIAWYSTPLLVLWAWTLVGFAAAVLITPTLIQKSPAPRPPTWLHFWIWFLLRLLFLVATWRHQLRLVSAIATVELVIVCACLGRVRLMRTRTAPETALAR